MSRFRKNLNSIVAITLFIIMCPNFIGAAVISSKRECANCHIEWMDDFKMVGKKIFVDRQIREANVMIAGRLGVVSTEEICYTCHDGSVLDSRDKPWMPGSHPVYVKPSPNVDIPKTFPLNKDGKIYCGTCHSAHGVDWGKKPDEKMLDRKIFLRFENPNSFICKQCHKNKVEGGSHNNHPINVSTIKIPQELYDLGGKTGYVKDQIICESCHKVHGAKGGYKLLIKSIKNSELCGICHKDKYVSSRDEASVRGTHPVNIVPKLAKVTEEAREKGSRIGEDGNIICLSCHKIHLAPQGTKLLLQNNAGSSLCILCHADQYRQIAQTKHDLRETAPNEKNIKGRTVKEDGLCSACHLPHGGTGAKMWAKTPAKDDDPIGRLCNSCHEKGSVAEKALVGKITHPVGKSISKVDGETNLPLWNDKGVKTFSNNKGEVNCASCHDVHRWDPASLEKEGISKAEGGANDSFLRIKNDVGSPLCYDCHVDKSVVENSDHDMSMMAYKHPRSHCIQILGEDKSEMLKLPKEMVHKLLGKKEGKTGICGTCHTPHNGLYYRLWSREPGPGENPSEKLCYSCHSAGKVAEIKQLGQYTHPTGVKLSNLGANIKTELPLFDKELNRVKDGEVMCFSCHNPHLWDPNKKTKGPGVKVEGDASNSFLIIAANDNNFAICASCHSDKWPIKNTKHDMELVRPKEKNLRGQVTSEVGVCGACHIVHNAAYKYRLWNRPLGPGDDPISKLCQSCHSNGSCGESKQVGQHSHPLGKDITNALQGKGPVPAFPTYTDTLQKVSPGKVYCSSCHDLHVWNPSQKNQTGDGKLKEGGMEDSFLRASNKNGYSFCVQCHPKKDLVAKTDHDMSMIAPTDKNYFGVTASKAGVCSACHVVHNTLSDFKLWARELGPGTDGISKLCRSCHNEKGVGKNKLITFTNDSHPINVDIRKADGKTSFPLFNFAGDRDKNGKVYCATCHDPHQWDPGAEKQGPGEPVEGDQTNSFIRGVRNMPNPDFCADCHVEEALVVGTDHDMAVTAPDSKNIAGRTVAQDGVCSACHIIHNGQNDVRLWGRKWGPSFIKNWNKNLGVENDRAIQYCTSCHSEGEPGFAKQPQRGLHPGNFMVGIRRSAYSEWTAPYNPLKYVYKTLTTDMTNRMFDDQTRPEYPPYTDSGMISLEEGDLTCPTCHNLHKWNPKKFEKGSGQNVEGHIGDSFLRNGLLYEFCIDCHSYDALYRMKFFHTERSRQKLDPPTKYDEIKNISSKKETIK